MTEKSGIYHPYQWHSSTDIDAMKIDIDRNGFYVTTPVLVQWSGKRRNEFLYISFISFKYSTNKLCY